MTRQSFPLVAPACVLVLLSACAPEEPVEEVIAVPNTDVRVALWEADTTDAEQRYAYAISFDGGSTYSSPRATSYEILIRDSPFVPTRATMDTGSGVGDLYIVQYVSQPLPAYRATLHDLGAEVYGYFPHHAEIVRMPSSTRDRVAELPFVRWIGPYLPSYRVSDAVDASPDADRRRFVIRTVSPDPALRLHLGDKLSEAGARSVAVGALGSLVEGELTPTLVDEVSTWDEVLYVEPWSRPETDMDIVREFGGANYLEGVAGYTGAGVRAEVMDGNVLASHVDFQSRPLLIHGGVSGSASHGTPTTGIVFGDGAGNSAVRGMLPDAQGIFASYEVNGGATRYAHTAELLDPEYEAVFQSNSWGSARTTQYTAVSAEMDAMTFDLDIAIVQSQSNSGTRQSRPQAWSKNVMSIGGFYHFDTLSRDDDRWASSASIGPAEDGRIKPDLSHFYDATVAPSSSGGYRVFGGTSGATPIVAGHLGLFYQMWADGAFSESGGPAGGGGVFASRPHMTTAKAMLIHTATQYDFEGTGDDLARVHQGWGTPDVRTLYGLRDRLYIVDESDVVPALEVSEHAVEVGDGEPALRVTMVYADPAGVPGAGQARVNDLSVRAVSPSGEFYWGNNGLRESNWSTPGGDPNRIDTVENILVQNPERGSWTIEVHAHEINQDGHVETEALDADYALLVSGSIPSGNRDPTVTVVSPTPGQSVSGAVAIVADASDPNGSVSQVVFTLPDGTEATDETAPYGVTWDSTRVGDGTATVSVVAIDDQGASSAPATVAVEVDNTTPCVDGRFPWIAGPAAIPDNTPTPEVIAEIAVSGPGRVDALALSLEITHTWRGDLTVTLTSPAGTVHTVHDRTGSSADDLSFTDLAIAAYVGEPAAGIWKLSVHDRAGADTGTLEAWSLRVTGGCSPGWSGSDSPGLPTVDGGTACATLTVASPGDASVVRIDLEGTHAWRSILRATLEHEGTTADVFGIGTFPSGQGSFSTNDQPVAGFSGDASGDWTLCIIDTDEYGDTGVLETWSVHD